MKKKQFLIMTVGKTHSGKTTFARELIQHIPNAVIIESDVIAVFLRRHFPKLHLVDRKRARSMRNPRLKLILFQEVVEYALQAGLNVVLSNSHAERKVRASIIRIARAHHAEVVMVWMNPPRGLLLSRIRGAHKSTRVLNESKNFQECLARQEAIFENPTRSEADVFFHIRNSKDRARVIADILTLNSKRGRK